MLLESEHLLDVEDDLSRSSSSKTKDRRVRELGPKDVEEFIVGPKVVAPLAHAVDLINRNPRQTTPLVRLLQSVHQAFRLAQLFRRHEENS